MSLKYPDTESAPLKLKVRLVSYPSVAEAAVVGMPHAIKGEGIYAYVTLKSGIVGTEELKKELVAHVRKVIGPIASPDKIQFSEGSAEDPFRARS